MLGDISHVNVYACPSTVSLPSSMKDGSMAMVY
jgi:hypothetical protein